MYVSKPMRMMDAITARNRTIDQIYGEITLLNSDFHENPNEIDGRRVTKLVDKLTEYNRIIEAKKQQSLERKCFNFFKHTDKLTYVLTGLTTLACVGTAIASTIIYIAKNPEERNPWYEFTLDVGSKTFAAFLTSIVALYLIGTDGDRNEKRQYFQLSAIRDEGAQYFREMMQALRRVQRDQNSPEKQTKELAKCLQCHERLPPVGFREKLPGKDDLATVLFQMLPESHPIKRQLRELTQAASELIQRDAHDNLAPSPIPKKDSPPIAESEESDATTFSLLSRESASYIQESSSSEGEQIPKPIPVDSILAPTPTNTKAVKTLANKILHKPLQIVPEISSPLLQPPSESESSVSTSPSPRRAFAGEKLAVPSFVMDLEDPFRNNPPIAFLEDRENMQMNQYRQNWKSLERILGVKLESFHFDNQVVAKNPLAPPRRVLRQPLHQLEVVIQP